MEIWRANRERKSESAAGAAVGVVLGEILRYRKTTVSKNLQNQGNKKNWTVYCYWFGFYIFKLEKITDKIKDHFENKKYAKIKKGAGKHTFETTSGYIVDYSSDFMLVQETDDFKVLGYTVLPINQIKKIRFNKWDKYYNKIMIWEARLKMSPLGIKST